jgi:hypothetical protein
MASSGIESPGVAGVPLDGPAGFAFDATGERAYFTNVADPNALWVLIPEPGTASLLLLGGVLGGIIARRSRRR